jgi:hypothetical protein
VTFNSGATSYQIGVDVDAKINSPTIYTVTATTSTDTISSLNFLNGYIIVFKNVNFEVSVLTAQGVSAPN